MINGLSLVKMIRKKITLKLVGLLFVFSILLASLVGGFLYRNQEDQIERNIFSRLTIFNERVDIRIQTISGEMEQLGVLLNRMLRSRLDSDAKFFDDRDYPRGLDGAIRVSSPKSGWFIPAGTPFDAETQKFISVSESFFTEVAPFVELSFTDFFYTTNKSVFRLNPPGNWVNEVEADYDANNYPFYALATEENNPSQKPVWIPIYYDAPLDSWLTSLLVPDYVNGALMGVSGNDFSLDRIFDEFITMANQDAHIVSAIFNKKGELVFHPDFSEEINTRSDSTGTFLTNSQRIVPHLQEVVRASISAGIDSKQLLQFIVDGKKQAAVVTPIDFLEWRIVSYICRDNVAAPLQKSFLQIALGLLLFILLLSFIIAQGIRHFILNRIFLLKKFSDGYLQDRETDFDVSGEDEIAELSHSFLTLTRTVKRRIEMDNIVTSVSQNFLNSPREKIDEQIEHSLQLIGEFSQADRAYLFIYSKDHTRIFNTHEWVRPGITPEREFYADVEARSLEELNQSIMAQQVFILQNETDPWGKTKSRSLLQPASRLGDETRSLICCPIVRGGVSFGFIGFDSVKSMSSWGASDTQILTLIGQIFYDALLRNEREEMRHQSQKMDAIGQLAGGVAHDFNNMLGGIIGAAEMLELGIGQKDDESREYIDIILQASDQAALLTNKLLAFGRKGKTTSDAIDVHEIINDALVLLRRTVDKKVSISTALQAHRSTIIGMASEIQNVIINLCINSSHAMPQGGTITIETEDLFLDEDYCKFSSFDLTPGEYIEITVRDNGKGIPQEILPRIFEPFFTSKEQGKGTGLGLASVYGSVLEHSGAISVYSETDLGSVFRIYIPLTVQKPNFSPPIEPVPGSGIILLVDDEEFVRITCKRMLENNGYTVLLAVDGVEGWDVFQKNQSTIDLVITDMIMPRMNGSELFKKIIKLHPKTRVITSSGFTKDESLEELKRLGLASFIRKPFRAAELTALIESVIR